jgi:hypothetical protein
MADTIGLGALADVHDGFAMLDDTDDEVLRTRAVEADCDGTRVLVLTEEDHLRVLCRHLLRHGATRPLWLCDVAVAVETRSPSFDWTKCLGASRRIEQWVIRALQLAHAMIGTSIENTPAAGYRSPLPAWVVPAVADSWSRISFGFSKLGHSFDSPAGFLGEVRRHWPNPLQATVAVRGPINAMPRLPFQLAACVPGFLRTTRDVLQRYQRATPLRRRET